jgi:hypothetical protein
MIDNLTKIGRRPELESLEAEQPKIDKQLQDEMRHEHQVIMYVYGYDFHSS